MTETSNPEELYLAYKEEFYNAVMEAPEVADILMLGSDSNQLKQLMENLTIAKGEFGPVKLRHPKAFAKLQMQQLEKRHIGGRSMIQSIVNEIVKEKNLSDEDESKFRQKVTSILDLVSFDSRQ